MRLTILLFFILINSIFAQTDFKVLGISGDIKKISKDNTEKLKTGDKLVLGESIQIESGRCVLIHHSGKSLEVSTKGYYSVVELTDRVSKIKTSSISKLYVDYVFNQIKKDNSKDDINKNHRRYMDVAGSVERGINNRIKVISPIISDILPKPQVITWKSGLKNVEYVVEVFNLYNDSLISYVTKDTSIVVNFKDLFDKYGRILVLSVSVKNGGKSEDFCFIRTDQIKLDQLSSDGTYISELLNGIECEDKGLYLDALGYYKKSMELWGLGDDVSTEASASYWILWHKLFK